MINKDIKKVVYMCLVGDLFHYGHLAALKFAKSLGDYLICGVLSNEAVKLYRRNSLINLEQRKEVIKNLNFVDRVITEEDLDSTKTLEMLHKEFDGAKLIFVRSPRWRSFPEYDYLKSIGGELVRYSTKNDISDFKIIRNLLESYKSKFSNFEQPIDYFKVRDFIDYDTQVIKNAIMSTKADTLRALNPLLKHSSIEKPFIFTLKEWKSNKEQILEHIKNEFSKNLIVIRSSAVNEDTYDSSMAGYFDTELNVPSDNLKMVENSINKVIDSYGDKKSLSDLNQILIQPQVTKIKMSGVVFTQTLENGAPYYTLNYDDSTGYSDNVTKGLGNKTVYLSKFCSPKNYNNDFYKLVMAVKEIEGLIPKTPLDIEFAINDKEEVIIFQVRPLILKSKSYELKEEDFESVISEFKYKFSKFSQKKNNLACEYTYFADMPDWNPAEIIGDRPNYLDYSLYDYVITDKIWHEARTSQGYYDVNPSKLVVLFGNKPYVDVRNTFNSFTPSSISKELREKLVNFYMNKLKNHPELQDKVEFEILYTCYDLIFDERSKELMENGFNKEEINDLKNALINITNNLILTSPISIKEDLQTNKHLALSKKEKEELLKNNKKEPRLLINVALDLLNNCKEKGTLQFSRLARLAFIGKIILKSLIKREIISKNDYDSFLSSISTVATSLNVDFMLLSQDKINKNVFLDKYGHLRPGTYDITSMRYDLNPKILETDFNPPLRLNDKKDFILDKILIKNINDELNKHKLNFRAEELFNFIKESLEARELSKFEFSKDLSYAIELIAEAGNLLGFSREDMAQLDIESLFKILDNDLNETVTSWRNLIDWRNKQKDLYSRIILPPIIFSEKDFEIISYYSTKPNFITRKKLTSEVLNLNSIEKNDLSNLKDKIILLESGDPGYDWIFTKNIAGLITKYGGVASHMSIRCAEFGLPAAIGCGELFDKIKNESHLLLDCGGGKIVPLKNNF